MMASPAVEEKVSMGAKKLNRRERKERREKLFVPPLLRSRARWRRVRARLPEEDSKGKRALGAERKGKL